MIAAMSAGVLLAVAAVAGFAVLLRIRHLVVVDISGVSMEPVLEAGDRLVVRRVPGTALAPGQIVVFEAPRRGYPWTWLTPAGGIDGRQWMVKRLAAVPGDPVPPEIADVVQARPGARVPAGFVVVLGDNSSASVDSRTIGYVPVERVLGIAVRRYGEPRREQQFAVDGVGSGQSRSRERERRRRMGPQFAARRPHRGDDIPGDDCHTPHGYPVSR